VSRITGSFPRWSSACSPGRRRWPRPAGRRRTFCTNRRPGKTRPSNRFAATCSAGWPSAMWIKPRGPRRPRFGRPGQTPRSGVELLERVVQILALGDENARKLVALCSGPRPAAPVTPPLWLADAKTPAFVARSTCGCGTGAGSPSKPWSTKAEEQLQSLRPEDVVDPATLLFYQGVVYYRLINQDAGLETLGQAARGPSRPRRYVSVAKLMEADLKTRQRGLARIISPPYGRDVRRRLRPGPGRQQGPRGRGRCGIKSARQAHQGNRGPTATAIQIQREHPQAQQSS